jgi:hypothetical protein
MNAGAAEKSAALFHFYHSWEVDSLTLLSHFESGSVIGTGLRHLSKQSPANLSVARVRGLGEN